ncbi:MAG: SDR family oxidoreductase [Ekhidna sp.]|nr:SDR family oxidoreductase [Ekhidna sp.]
MRIKKILITGANGLLGQKLIKHYHHNTDVQIIATGIKESRLGEGNYTYCTMDVTSKKDIERVVSETAPNVIIHTAAMTRVDQCETAPETCWNLNVTAVDHLVKASKKNNSFIIHLSTDFIFDGKAGPYKEDDTPAPINHYGESKLASEELLQKSTIRYAIVRTQLVYGITSNPGRLNIVLWVKKNLEERKTIKVVNDQWRTPTLAEDLAKGCALLAEREAEGIFNISGKDMLSPYDMAVATADFFNLDKSLIEEVDGSIFTQPAKRPPKTGFILDKARETLGYEPVSFRESLAILKSQLTCV